MVSLLKEPPGRWMGNRKSMEYIHEGGNDMKKIKVITWGLGNMGRGITEMLLTKEGIEVVGAIEKRVSKDVDLGIFLNKEVRLNVPVGNDPERIILQTEPDLCILAINSFVKGVVEEISVLASHGVNVITIAEEMAYPYYSEPLLSERIDKVAKENGISVLGTGVNPGFVLDTLILQLSMCVRRVDKIKAVRINDLSPFGMTVMEEQGVGRTEEDFRKGIEDGSVYGHVGFLQSIPMLAKALGLEYDEIVQTREPIISKVYRETKDVVVKTGMVAGCNHTAVAKKDGVEVIILEHPQQVRPDLEEIETGDYIEIFGDPNIKMQIKPEVPGGIGTIAAAVNVIPHVLNAQPGLITMLDIPVVHAIMDDFRNHLK